MLQSHLHNTSTAELIILPDRTCWIEKFTLSKDLQCSPESFQDLLKLRPALRGTVKIMGKEINVPRWQQSFGRDYKFSGMNHQAKEISNEYLLKLMKFVQEHSGKNYDQMLINWYLDGHKYIGAHSDDETQLVKSSSIYSFSFGASRDFIVTSKNDKQFKLTIPLKNNDVIIMGGETQSFYKHAVPKRLKVKDPRINITMRLYKDSH